MKFILESGISRIYYTVKDGWEMIKL